MRILMVYQMGEGDTNPYVSSLVFGLIKCGHEVICSRDLFWESFPEYDLLYLQWPEAIIDWGKEEIDIEKISRHFNRIKEARVKTVITCHNLHPHNYDPKIIDLYNVVYTKVDAFHHMGRYSYNLFMKKYPRQYHFIAPHHVADSLWKNPLNLSEAKKNLHIPKKSIVVSSFGAFRNREETRLFVDMAKDICNRHIYFLAPRIPMMPFYIGRHIRRSIRSLKEYLLYKMIRVKSSGILTDEELSIWLSASDVVFIQRKEILNSGNLPLAYSAGKIVVGPDLGNVGVILKETGNFTFNPNDRGSVKHAVKGAIEAVKKNNVLGLQNYHYAKENWSTSKICELISGELSKIVYNE